MNVKKSQKWLRTHNKNIPLTHVAKSTGLNYFWLVKFTAGDIKNPGFEKMNKVLHYIEGYK